MKLIKLQSLIIFFVSFLFTMNFMFLIPSGLKWDGKFPVVTFKLSSIHPNLKSEKELEAIQEAAKKWSFSDTKGHFNFSYNGKTTQAEPYSPSSIGCTDEFKQEAKETENTVFYASPQHSLDCTGESCSQSVDPDCTGAACTYLWSCENENKILHFDIQLNYDAIKSANPYSANYNIVELQSILARELDYVVGLGHCSPGDTSHECLTKSTSIGQSDPKASDIMYRLPPMQNPGCQPVVNTGTSVIPLALVGSNETTCVEQENIIGKELSDDDKNGVKALYGTLSSKEIEMSNRMNEFYQEVETRCLSGSCEVPELSSDEMAAKTEHDDLLNQKYTSIDTIRLKKHKMFQELYHNAYSQTGISAEEYLLTALKTMNEKIHEFEKGSLIGSKRLLAVQIKDRENAVKNYQNDLDSTYLNFLDAEMKTLIMIKREMTNEINNR